MPRPQQAAQAQTSQQQRKQRERYVRGGGLLQGYAPEFVERIGLYSVGVAAVCVVIMAAILVFLPYPWPVRGVAAAVWIVPIAFLASFVLPGYRLARKDRKLEPRMVQGQLVGASQVSTSFGLGMLMIKTRAGQEQYLVPVERLNRVPGNQVTVMLTVTPNLNHVRSVGVMGQRMVGRPEQPIPEVVRRLRLLPLVSPAALCAGAIIGGDAVALSPIGNAYLHTAAAALAAVVLAGGTYGVFFLIQRRLYAEVQQMVPGGF